MVPRYTQSTSPPCSTCLLVLDERLGADLQHIGHPWVAELLLEGLDLAIREEQGGSELQEFSRPSSEIVS